MDGIIPFTMPGIRFQVDLCDLLVGDPAVGLIVSLIKLAMDLQPLVRGGSGDQINNHLMGNKRFAPPVLRDKGKETMFNFIPLTGARR